MIQSASLADLPAFHCGHAQDASAGTGCTVFIAPQGATCGIDVRGGGPATRETDLLRPENMIESVHAVVLSGGSAFGLAASTGVMDNLVKRNIGFPLGDARVPIVVGACLFDLLVGENTFPDAAMGSAACDAAFAEQALTPLQEGNVGAGCGASVGKLIGPDHAMKSGFGLYGIRMGDLVVCAAVAVNALGCVCDETGTWIAGCHDAENKVLDPLEAFEIMVSSTTDTPNDLPAEDLPVKKGATNPTDKNPSSDPTDSSGGLCSNTTLGVILTNAQLTKAQATKTASTAHDAYARAIKPVHTSNDGDTIFTFASGEVTALPDAVAILATEAMQKAIVRAVKQASGSYGLPAASDLTPQI